MARRESCPLPTEIDSRQPISNNRLLRTAAKILNEILDENKLTASKSADNTSKNKKCATIFDSKKVPTISLYDYLERLTKYTKMEESTLVIALIYIDRICEYNDIELNDLNIHRYKII
jgi:hypothetical protein